MPDSSLLRVLHASIESRCDAIARSHDWPCREGCGRCCRRLSGIPAVTQAEWDLIWEAYLGLPKELRGVIRERALSLAPPAPYTCPFLDTHANRCQIYEARPVACRTYGFYVDRGLGLYCAEMLARDRKGEWDNVIWGNAASVESKMAELGENKDVQQWFLGQDA